MYETDLNNLQGTYVILCLDISAILAFLGDINLIDISDRLFNLDPKLDLKYPDKVSKACQNSIAIMTHAQNQSPEDREKQFKKQFSKCDN